MLKGATLRRRAVVTSLHPLFNPGEKSFKSYCLWVVKYCVGVGFNVRHLAIHPCYTVTRDHQRRPPAAQDSLGHTPTNTSAGVVVVHHSRGWDDALCGAQLCNAISKRVASDL